MEENTLYDLKKTADILGITYTQVYKYVNTCKNCKKKKELCDCGNFEAILQSIDVGSGGQRIRHRIASVELNNFIKGRVVK
jgi:hypothetical protein